jgi:hypothetical protein
MGPAVLAHGRLVAAAGWAVRVDLENERAREATVQLGHDDARAVLEGALEQPHLPLKGQG